MASYGTSDHNHEESIRSMRLKILYTFDGQNKTNHLARWPDVLPVRKISIDQTTTVGVVLLQTCLRAIIEASPELVTGTHQDYTIYTHDYSESEYPLFGQGLLSKALSALSPSSDSTLASQPEKLITGRVYHDAHGIFTSDVKETLEVKMKLVPVPSLDAEYSKPICKCRHNFCATSNTFKTSEWDSLMQADSADRSNNCFSNNITKYHKVGSNQVMRSQIGNSERLQQQLPVLLNSRNTDYSGNESTEDSAIKLKPQKKYKSSSKTSAKRSRDRKARLPVIDESLSSNEEVIDKDEASSPKKRTKINKTQWNPSSNFGRNPSSLRVTAATSSTLRLLRPTNMNYSPNKSYQTESSLLPEPVLQIKEQKSETTKPQLKLKLRRNSNTSQGPSLNFEKTANLQNYSCKSNEASPERSSSLFDTGTPPGMTSSPPVMKTHTPRIRSSTPCPSSPSLPQLPMSDSCFNSGVPEKNSGEIDAVDRDVKDSENEMQKTTKTLKRRHSAFTKNSIKHMPMDFIIEEECPGPMDQLPTKMSVSHQQVRARCAVYRNNSTISDDNRMHSSLSQLSRTSPPRSKSQHLLVYSNILQSSEKLPYGRSEPMLVPLPNSNHVTSEKIYAASKDSFPRSKIPASDPILPHSRIQCPQNFVKDLESTEVPRFKIPLSAQSNTLQSMQTGPASLATTQSFSKKEMIKQKLEIAVANGEMPPFCCNCGAIETPTWRKAWSKEMKGQPGYFEYSDEPGRVTAIIILSRDPEGNPTSYNLIKKYLGKDESQDDYSEYLLCNPCGIWMSKYKTSRPEERWESNSDKTSKAETKKRPTQRLSRSKKTQSSSLPTPASEVSHLPSDPLIPLNEGTEFPEEPLSLELHGKLLDQKPLKQKEKSARNFSVKKPGTQSSPVRSAGTQQSPIDLENDLGNTRRLLFPSPLKETDPKIIDESISNTFTKVRKFCSSGLDNKNVDEEKITCKISDENIETQILQLFGEDSKIESQSLTLLTPNASAVDLFKTPPRKSPKFGSITRSVSLSARSGGSSGRLLLSRNSSNNNRLSPDLINDFSESPFTATLNQLISESKKSNSPTINFDFGSLPELSEAATSLDMDISFPIEDFFSDDMFNSNTSPELNFDLHDNLVEDVTNTTWQNLSCFDHENVGNSVTDISVKEDSLIKSTVNVEFEPSQDIWTNINDSPCLEKENKLDL